MNELVTLQEVQSIETPEPTATHHPIPHGVLIEMVRNSFGSTGYRVETER